MGTLADHVIAEIPVEGTYNAAIALRIERICDTKTRLPWLALELFLAAPYKRTGILAMPLWNDYRMAYIFFKVPYHGYSGTLVFIIQENTVDVLSVQLKCEDHEIKITGETRLLIRDNRGNDLGNFDAFPAMINAIDRLAWFTSIS